MAEQHRAGQVQCRQVDTSEGSITYTLTRKPVKNLNLRVSAGGLVALSVPLRCSDRQADEFLRARSGWISRVLARRKRQEMPLLPQPSREACFKLLRRALERVYPLVQPLGVPVPVLKIRRLKSQWGNCHWSQGYITLNIALARCPEHLLDYVALHELVHFLHHDHGPGFYARMDALMPDWRNYRRELKGYGVALEQEESEGFYGIPSAGG